MTQRPYHKRVARCILLTAGWWATTLFTASFSQVKTPFDLVNPFIGTTKSNVFTKWGNEGGTYPGAVAPSGYLQLSPETKGSGGYDYTDSSIYFFSCLHHNSGFPGGSAGRLYVMPVAGPDTVRPGTYCRSFHHADEKAEPGYYRVLFRDNNTLAEATASTRAAMFRFTFPAGIVPRIFIGNAGRLLFSNKHTLQGEAEHSIISFSEAAAGARETAGGYMLTFTPSARQEKIIILKLSVSSVGFESAQANIDKQIGVSGFDALRQKTRVQWEKALSVISIADSNEQNKTIFYTALYHSLLLPWIISDVDGRYRGLDGLVHTATGKNEYGGFSPWDTFRSLHPLLSLLFPRRQNDMVLSMLEIYRQTGHLPVESMTGNHAVPIIVDSWLKGITGFDSSLAWAAMKKSIMEPPFMQPDLPVYQANGYIPFSYPESVTRTVEYAYDDWALAQFAKQVLHREADYNSLLQRSFSYRNLFNSDELFLLPRKDNVVKLQPGTFGYKEGDKWVYSYFVPQHIKDLVNLMGGKELFTDRLDAALANNNIVFDNETTFHIPYLFNYAGSPQHTQYWARTIMASRYGASPGGLPGNDDLGSMSAWYVLSAMGIFPVCPGRTLYDIGSPLFRSLTIHFANGKTLRIKALHSGEQQVYIKSIQVNNKPYRHIQIPHSLLLQGGEIVFDMDRKPADDWFGEDDATLVSEAIGNTGFKTTGFTVSKQRVEPGELFRVWFSVKNNGSVGTKTVRLFINGQPYAYKHCMVASGSVITDSISCRLYPYGTARLRVENLPETAMEVVPPASGIPGPLEIKTLSLKPVIHIGDIQQLHYKAQNTGGAVQDFIISISLNDSLLQSEHILLQPGEERELLQSVTVSKEGLQTLSVNKVTERFKAYSSGSESLLLDLPLDKNTGDNLAPDKSGFANNGTIVSTLHSPWTGDSLLFGKDCFVEVPASLSLDSMGETITMMLWVYPTGGSNGLVDLLTKGDNHVLQVAGNKMLTFFAGGWGRGDCTVPLPANWMNHWHHLAGVCTGDSLYVYIDGRLQGSSKVDGRVNLSVPNKWNIGRNDEFPSDRIFNGFIKGVKVFAAPLKAAEIVKAASD